MFLQGSSLSQLRTRCPDIPAEDLAIIHRKISGQMYRSMPPGMVEDHLLYKLNTCHRNLSNAKRPHSEAVGGLQEYLTAKKKSTYSEMQAYYAENESGLSIRRLMENTEAHLYRTDTGKNLLYHNSFHLVDQEDSSDKHSRSASGRSTIELCLLLVPGFR